MKTTDFGADEIWHAIDTQRLSLLAVLDGLTDEDWRQPSLCSGWTVRDVAAHLTMQQMRLPESVMMVLRHPAGLNTMIRDAALRRAAAPPEELVDAIRATVGSRRHNTGVTCRETLIDILVHSQDIALPLGRPAPMPPAAAAVAASRVWARNWPFYPRRRLNGFLLSATDTSWSVGHGERIEGPMDALLLLLTGRHTAVSRLSGAGLPTLAAAVVAP